MKTSQYVVCQLYALKKLGVAISIDDFGTAFFFDEPIKRFTSGSTQKLDRQFYLGNRSENPRDEAVISVMIHLARELGLTVTAEGVETPAQLALSKSGSL